MAVINNNLREITDKNIVKMTLMSSMSTAVNDEAIAVRNLVLVNETSEMQLMLKRIEDNNRKFGEAKSKLEGMLVTVKGKEAFAKIMEGYKAKEIPMQKAIEFGMAHKKAEATSTLLTQVRPIQRKLALDDLSELADAQNGLNKIAIESAEKAYSSARLFIIVICAVAIILGVIAAIFITRNHTAAG